MRKSRLLSLLLTVVFILANVTIPAFAASQFTYTPVAGFGETGTPTYISPIPGHPFHFAVTANDPEDPTKEYNYQVYTTNSTAAVGVDAFSVDENGLFSIGDISEYVPSSGAPSINPFVKVRAVNKADSSDVVTLNNAINTINPGVSWDFEDGYYRDLSSVELAEDTTGNHYLKRIPNGSKHAGFGYGDSIWFPASKPGLRARYYFPVVLEFDTNDIDKGIGTYGSSTGFGTTFANSSTPYYVPGVWNNVKIIIDGPSATYEVFMNDKAVNSGALDTTNTNNGFRYFVNTIDNLKHYQSSLGFAYDVTLTGSDDEIGVGDTITASAKHYSFAKFNVPEELQVEFAIADTLDGEYTFLADASSPLTITEAYEGKFIKVRARVQETELSDFASEWVYSDEYATLIPELAYVNGDPANYLDNGNVMAPVAGLPLRISHKLNVPATYTLSDTTKPGITLSDDGILTITKDAGAYSAINTANVTVSANTDYFGEIVGPKIGSVFGSFEYTFDDGRLPVDDCSDAPNRAPGLSMVIKSDASGRIYGDSTRSDWIEMHTQYLFHNRAGIYMSPFILEADFYDLHDFHTYYTGKAYRNSFYRTSSGKIDQGWIDFATDSGATFNPDFDYKNFNSRYAWHHFKWVITPNAKVVDDEVIYAHYDLYIDNTLLVKNAPIYIHGRNGSLQDGNGTAYSIYAYANGIDNFRRYSTSLGFAHDVKFTGDAIVGSTLTASAELAHTPQYNIPETLEKAFFVSDSANGEYTLVATGDSYVVGAEAAGKYIKSAARVKENLEDGYATEWVLSNETVFVPVSAISSIALKVDGADADIDAVNLAGKTEAQIDITITAASSDESAAKFVLAQYATVDGKKVLVGAALNNADLTAEANTFDLSLKASNIDADTTFRLFILTSNGLVPVKDIVLK